METLTNNGVTCFLHKANKCRYYYAKKMFAGVARVKVKKVRIETRDGTIVEEFALHCHVENVLNSSATVLRTREKHRNTS